MQCLSPVTIVKKYSKSFKRTIHTTKRTGGNDFEDGILVNCGQCISCRIRRKREWSLRCAHEASMYEQNSFITLTYNDDNLPEDLSLNKHHCTQFMKDLRAELYPRKIRFYMAAEYGSPTDDEIKRDLSQIGRPHYHYLIFNWIPDDLKYLRVGKKGDKYYSSPTVEKAWGHKGFVVVGTLTPESASYTAGYCTKKITGTEAEEHYTRIHPITGKICHVLPEFQRQSQGIGAPWVDKYASDLQKGFLTFDGKTYPIPRYYLKRLSKKWEKNPTPQLTELIDNIQEARANPISFDVLPDFEELNYSYNVAKVYQDRAKERDLMNTL